MKRMIRIVALLMAALMAVTSCQAPDSGSQMASETVDVSFAGPSARTITTDDGLVQTVATSDLWFQYKAEWEGEGDAPSTVRNEWTNLSGPGLSGTFKLHRGIWKLSLRAFVNKSDVGTDGRCILSGTVPGVNIGTNNAVVQTVTVNLSYVRQEGNGTLHISATYPVVYREGDTPTSDPVEAIRKIKVTANVADTDYTGEITAFDSNNVGVLDLQVPAGVARVTVQYYMDENTLFEDDQTSKDVLIMATMTTNFAVSVDRDITAVTFTVEQPAGTVEDNVKIFNSIFDIYPDTIADNQIVIGYAEQTKALNNQTPITYPYMICSSATPDGQGRYKASDLGLVPITVNSKNNLNSKGVTEAWWGKAVNSNEHDPQNTTLTTVRFVDGITSINSYLFDEYSNLTDVIIPDGVISIERCAFSGCTGLTSITIPDSVTSIGNSAFFNCSGLTNITIPDSVTSIGNQAFYACTSLTTIPDNLPSIGSNMFYSCTSLTNVTIPDGVTSIGAYAFQNCTGLISVTIPESVTSIGNKAFDSCSSLTEVTYDGTVDHWYALGCAMPSTVNVTCTDGKAIFIIEKGISNSTEYTSIKGLTPYGKTNCTEITIPENVTKIESGAFRDCTEITSVTMPDSITSIGTGTFMNCTALTSVTMSAGITFIDQNMFNGCSALPSITIPEGVRTLEYSAFKGCTSLTSVTFPESIKEIGDSAFKTCTSLSSITIPESVTSISHSVFEGCTGLTSVTILTSSTAMGFSIFKDCTALTDVYVNQPESSFISSRVPEGCRIHWNSRGPESESV